MLKKILRWLPALLTMAVIFAFSSIPGKGMPDFGVFDLSVKKLGHVTVYALLALSFAYAFEWNPKRFLLAWVLCFLYAISDEFHQSFTPGRNAWWVDVALDSIAAALALWAVSRFNARVSPNPDKNS